MVEVKRKDGESFESMLRRFNRKIQQSGILVRARRIQFYVAPKSRNLARVSAKRRTELAEEREHLKKMGKLPPGRFSRRPKR